MSKFDMIVELMVKNGVTTKFSESLFKNLVNDEPIIELDFSEHDKVFEDKIADLENIINHKLGDWNKHGITYQEIMDMKAENQELKQITKGYEDKIAELKKDYKTASELLGKYQQENESLKKRVVELENFSCQAEQETESLVEKLNQHIVKLEKSRSEWIDKTVEWQQKCEKLEIKETSDLPFDPLECANYLINATYERETSSLERAFAKVPDKVNSDRYTIDDLEQIAEHLLVYCKHNKECEE